MPNRLLDLLTPYDVFKDSAIFAILTSPWAILSSLDKTLVLGLINIVVVAFFRWRSLKLKRREMELRHGEEVASLRTRLSRYERVEQPDTTDDGREQNRLPLLPGSIRKRGVTGGG